LEIVFQAVANAVCAGASYALIALGFGLILRAAGVFHVAHGFVMSLAAYTVWWMVPSTGLLVSCVVSLIVAAIVGLSTDKFIYRPMRIQGAQRTQLLIASLGILIFGQALLSLFFGDDVQTIDVGPLQGSVVIFDGVRLTYVQLAMLVVGLGSCLIYSLVIQFTGWGRVIRAVSEDTTRAEASGIPVHQTVSIVLAFGSVAGAVASILIALDVGLTPTLGFDILFLGVVTAIVAGTTGGLGVVVAGMGIALFREAGGWWLSAYWQDAIVFVVMIGFMFLRPQGLFGQKIWETR